MTVCVCVTYTLSHYLYVIYVCTCWIRTGKSSTNGHDVPWCSTWHSAFSLWKIGRGTSWWRAVSPAPGGMVGTMELPWMVFIAAWWVVYPSAHWQRSRFLFMKHWHCQLCPFTASIEVIGCLGKLLAVLSHLCRLKSRQVSLLQASRTLLSDLVPFWLQAPSLQIPGWVETLMTTQCIGHQASCCS